MCGHVVNHATHDMNSTASHCLEMSWPFSWFIYVINQHKRFYSYRCSPCGNRSYRWVGEWFLMDPSVPYIWVPYRKPNPVSSDIFDNFVSNTQCIYIITICQKFYGVIHWKYVALKLQNVKWITDNIFIALIHQNATSKVSIEEQKTHIFCGKTCMYTVLLWFIFIAIISAN